MTKLEIVLCCVTTISILINVGVFVYARSVVTQLLSVSEELGDLKNMIDSFANHTRDVYGMEMFYGDQTLESLMDHARSLNEQLDTFEYIYSLTEEGKIITDDAEDDTEENEEET